MCPSRYIPLIGLGNPPMRMYVEQLRATRCDTEELARQFGFKCVHLDTSRGLAWVIRHCGCVWNSCGTLDVTPKKCPVSSSEIRGTSILY